MLGQEKNIGEVVALLLCAQTFVEQTEGVWAINDDDEQCHTQRQQQERAARPFATSLRVSSPCVGTCCPLNAQASDPLSREQGGAQQHV